MKKYLITIGICFSILNLFAQDLIYTVSGEIDENKTALDSILVENLTNDKRILFDNLPELDYYQINLTQNAFWGTVGVNSYEKTSFFNASENRPGSLTIDYLDNNSTDLNLSVYNVNGQKVFDSGRKKLNPGNSIDVKLSQSGMFLLKIETLSEIRSFKMIGNGTDNFKDPDIKILAGKRNAILKSTLSNHGADVSFLVGDSIRISVFKEYYNTAPLSQMLDSSKFVNFLFELNSTGEVGSLTDSRDGKTYTTVTVDGKEWMSQALAYLPSISKVTSSSKTEPHYYVYDYNDTIVSAAIESDNYKTYGALYNLPAAKSACPVGWHLPTLDEWVKLSRFITDQNGFTHTSGDFWEGVGGCLKATSGWNGDGNGTDKYGFNGLPSGYRHMNENFYGKGSSGFWWTNTELTSTNAVIIYLQSSSNLLIVSHNESDFGYCIRCIKD